MGSIALHDLYFVYVFPLLCPAGNITSQGWCKLKKAVTDSPKMVPSGTHLQRETVSGWRLQCTRLVEARRERRPWHSLWGRGVAVGIGPIWHVFPSCFLSNNNRNNDLKEWVPYVAYAALLIWNSTSWSCFLNSQLRNIWWNPVICVFNHLPE